MNGFKLRAGYDVFTDAVGFLLEEIIFPGEGNPRRIVTELISTSHERGQIIKPTFTMYPSQVQELFDNLWKEGYRPKDGSGNGGHVAAIQYHLEDMRKLVFDKTRQGDGE